MRRALTLQGTCEDYFAYNFIKIHSTLRMSPAMAAGVTTRLFDVADRVTILVESESRKAAQAAKIIGVLGRNSSQGFGHRFAWTS